MNMDAQRYNGFDWLRGVAILFIVTLHLSVGTTPSWSRISIFGAQSGVAVFAAISGFLLAVLIDRSRGGSVWSLVSHRATRLLPPYLKWTAFYLVALSFMDWRFGVPHGYLANFSPRFLAAAVLRGAAEIHLWFVPSLFFASVALVVVDMVLWKPLRGAWAYLFCGAAIGLAASYAGTNFTNHDARLFGWVMLGMGLSRIVRRPELSDAMRRTRMFAAAAILPALAASVFAKDTVLWHVADFVFTLLLLLAFSGPALPRSRVASFLSRTSLTVYYFHVFVSRVLSITLRSRHPEPLDMVETLSLWMLVWLTALAFAALCGSPLLTWRRPARKANASENRTEEFREVK